MVFVKEYAPMGAFDWKMDSRGGQRKIVICVWLASTDVRKRPFNMAIKQKKRGVIFIPVGDRFEIGDKG